MFYADFVLSKKGPLARIWLAAHWDKKLTKAQVFETNIEKSVEGILQPKVKIALRTSGHLLLGVVRIYSRKAKYLLQDCNEAFVKIKMAFRPGMVDLPEDHRETAANAVTLPEVFHDFNETMVDLHDVDIEMHFQNQLNQSRVDEITMREEFGQLAAMQVKNIEPDVVGFGDMGFDASSVSDVLRQSAAQIDHSLNMATTNEKSAVGEDRIDAERDTTNQISAVDEISMDIDGNLNNDFDANLSHVPAGGLFEGGLFDEPAMGEMAAVENSSLDLGGNHFERMDMDDRLDMNSPRLNDDDDYDDHFAPPSPIPSSDGSRPASPVTTSPRLQQDRNNQMAFDEIHAQPVEEQLNGLETGNAISEDAMEQQDGQDQTTLLQNEEETFALAPVDASAIKGLPSKAKRKRKLIVDEMKNISGDDMKEQLRDTSDILTTLDLAPPTRRLMHWKETGGVERLFSLPSSDIDYRFMFQVVHENYSRHLILRAKVEKDEEDDGDQDLNDLPIMYEKPVAPVPGKRGRKRKVQVMEEEPPVPVQRSPIVEPDVPIPEPLHNGEVHFDGEMHVDEENGVEPMMNNSAGIEARIRRESVNKDVDSADIMLPNKIPRLDIQDEGRIYQSPSPIHAGVTKSPLPLHDHVLEDIPVIGSTNRLMGKPLNDNLQEEAIISDKGDKLSDMTYPIDNTMMENMGYDEQTTLGQNGVLLDNMGYDDSMHNGPANTPGAMTNLDVDPQTPWLDDYDNAPSVMQPGEEQASGETTEQFEERVLNKRAGLLFNTIKERLTEEKELSFLRMVEGNTRKQVAQKFYSLLVLKKYKALEVSQEESYSDIILTKGSNFEDPNL